MKLTPRVCLKCLGRDGRKEPDCTHCNGFGWLWSDGVKPRLCPGGGRKPLVKNPRELPCGRSGKACPGCDRPRAVIDEGT